MRHHRSTIPYRSPRFIPNPKYRWRPLTPNQSMLLIAGGLLIAAPLVILTSPSSTGDLIHCVGLSVLLSLPGLIFLTWCVVNWSLDALRRHRVRSGKYYQPQSRP